MTDNTRTTLITLIIFTSTILCILLTRGCIQEKMILSERKIRIEFMPEDIDKLEELFGFPVGDNTSIFTPDTPHQHD